LAADSKAKLIEDAESFVLHGKVQQAISQYLKVIEIDPSDVLILNTIGDLYLRKANSHEASKYFIRVAESYVQNNFFLKAIAVYKKILNADPDNIEINSMMASLFAKQGLSIDARNQYLRVAELLEKQDKKAESLEVYEKIVELDPLNADIQFKLAELNLAEGAEEKAHANYIAAARAQKKAGDLKAAVSSFERAMQLLPLDVDAMKLFIECCMKTDNVKPVLEQLKLSVEQTPENLDLREMLAQAYLASGDPAAAARVFQVVVSMEDSRYSGFFEIGEALIAADLCDNALNLLEAVTPILISRRETARAIELCELILEQQPKHEGALRKLADTYAASGDLVRHLEILDTLADHYLGTQSPVEAVECLEKILQADPDSEKHRNLHRNAFKEAYPDADYVDPVKIEGSLPEDAPQEVAEATAGAQGKGQSSVVEVDLLLNYGLREKALSLLLTLESNNPYDKEVRKRLLSVYKADKNPAEAAQQCLLLGALHRRDNNEEEARKFLSEAGDLDPDVAENEAELESFALQHGISLESDKSDSTAREAIDHEGEVDLSGDLLDIFYSKESESVAEDQPDSQTTQETMEDEFPQEISSPPPEKSIEEQLQEVDFYLRLGFNDEARAKLEDIEKISPDNPEVALRYEKLGGAQRTGEADAAELELSASPDPGDEDTIQTVDASDFEQLDQAADLTADPDSAIEGSFEEDQSAPFEQQPETSTESTQTNVQANEMFADLMDEIDAPENPEAVRADFEDHYSLGTAYREMDLVEEAIKEFQTALKSIDILKGDPKVIQCCGMLTACFLKKNMPRSALRWCQAGLSVADISSHEGMALRYDMGVAFTMEGENKRALECFDQIFSLDPAYRDVAQKIDELKGGFKQNASYP